MKRALRKEMLATLAAMSAETVAAKSHQACRRLADLEEFRSSSTVMIYLPMPRELDTAPLALAAWQDGKTVVAPRVFWGQRHMIPVLCQSLNDKDLSPGRFGVREPLEGEPWPLEEIDLVVAPALAFDRRGHRLGRGGGFYDRFLASPLLKAAACGLGFAEQVVEELPIADNDHRLDILVTDKEVLRFEHHKSRRAE
jgi:5-formyltetrahydrofolate cyclo-ligase